MRYQLVIFDFDGTLANTLPWIISLIDEIVEKFRIKSPDKSQLQSMRSYSPRQLMKMHEVSIWKLPRMVKFVRNRMKNEAHQILPFEGSDKILRALTDRKIQLAMVTTNSKTNIRKVLGEELFSLFSIFEDRIPMFGKSAALKRVLKKSGVPSNQTLCVGDESRDIIAAHHKRIPIAAVTWGYANPESLLEHVPEFIVNTFEELLKIIDGEYKENLLSLN
jgi:phosphoglycolate phosphatase